MHFAAGNPFADPQLFAKREFAAIKYSTRPSTEIVTAPEARAFCPEMLHSVQTCIGTLSQIVGAPMAISLNLDPIVISS